MIISQNRDPSLDEFKDLVDNATLMLNEDAKINTGYFLTRNAQLLEKDVYTALKSCAVNTKFQDKITIVSGQKFPDIIADKYYGVEVKSSKDEKWITLGGSVNESTRVKGVERIFLTFGKLVAPVEFRSRPYEDCLSEVVVTHYPRYKIDMNLQSGETIFDKMYTTYDKLCGTGNAVGEIIKYFKEQSTSGERLWWLGEESTFDQMKIRLFSVLKPIEKQKIISEGLVLFPEIFTAYGNGSRADYKRLVLWMMEKHGTVSPSTRDSFSASGRIIIKNTQNGEIHDSMPQIFLTVHNHRKGIVDYLYHAATEELEQFWGVTAEHNYDSRFAQWLNLVADKCLLDGKNIRNILKSIFDDQVKITNPR